MKRDGPDTIAKLKTMDEMRQKADRPFMTYLDTFGEGDRIEIIDSAKVLGARYIMKYF